MRVEKRALSGVFDGVEESVPDGIMDREREGLPVLGCNVGWCDLVGSVDGPFVGSSVGKRDGNVLGLSVGDRDLDGKIVGELEGFFVGFIVGENVGSNVG
mmetsp:Transcript_3511/g.4064  ORF Transcript_3511/g.4064 Transcript_3511/m.4064 type:complete len:100 (+) Transcript_3511:1596-1895(+)